MSDCMLDTITRHFWDAQRVLDSGLPADDRARLHWEGRQAGLWVLLQAAGALPFQPQRQSGEQLRSALVAARSQQPDGLEHLTISQAHQWLQQHGVEAAPHEVPRLQRLLVAGRLQKENREQPPTVVGDQHHAAVTADPLHLSGPHPASVGGAA